jgi:hypothetical protein
MLIGCVAAPTQKEVDSADYGIYPSNYEAVVKEFYSNILKDPYSAEYRNITGPKKFWLSDRSKGSRYGYLVCVTINAKNSYGAYVGYKTDGLLIRNDSVIQYLEKGVWFAQQMC